MSSFKKKFFVAFILGFFLSFLIIFLEPFDTNDFHSNYRNLLLSGFGVFLFLVSLIYSSIENFWYYKVNRVWLVAHEIISTLLFFLILGTVIYLYNQLVVNNLEYTLQSHWWYYKNIVIVFIPVIAPLLLYLRQKFGERIVPISKNSIIIHGENKNELLSLKKNELLYIKAVENYIEIFFIDTDNNRLSKTFRQTLSNVHKQLPFLEKCHRSYLVNFKNIKEIQGNSQSAKISFLYIEDKIPLSKTRYKTIKSKLL